MNPNNMVYTNKKFIQAGQEIYRKFGCKSKATNNPHYLYTFYQHQLTLESFSRKKTAVSLIRTQQYRLELLQKLIKALKLNTKNTLSIFT